ncbi:MAG: alpha/beta hydrolase [Burkholderiales bacterium]|uniref:alpha/beta fold hydrolase n=1 Tax=Inhella sp. TaxID=1921806 RepID=UPI001AC46E46|nr:alpha/beta hydrolase [Burkholderiales bacterium]
MSYTVLRPPRSRFEALRGLRLHALQWDGDDAQPLRVLVHGWMDVAASFQFLVDALPTGAPLLALDWRGFGHSEAGGHDAYFFADYLGDLDAWLDLVSPGRPVDLIAHSMGGNVAMLYAGVRPHRVRRLVNLEGFGMPDSDPAAAPERLRHWMDELRVPAQLKPYPSLAAVAQRLMKTNPRLSPERADWLASRWSEPDGEGSYRLLADPIHKRAHAVLYRKAEALACWRRIEAPVLFVEGEDDSLAAYWGTRYPRADLLERLAVVPQLRHERLQGAGHMLHHDQPEVLARLVEGFLT